VRFDASRLSLGAQGTYLVFESGNRILQGTAAGAWLAPIDRLWRLELSGSSGVSAYESYPVYGHVLARARLHASGRTIGAWVGAAAGRSFSRDTVVTPYQVGLGTWIARARLGGGLTIQRNALSDSSYWDIVGTARLRDPHIELEATLGARPWSHGPPRGLYGEVSAHLPLTPAAALLVSGGRYPADPVRGVIGARYVSIAIRLTAPHVQRTPIGTPSPPTDAGGGNGRTSTLVIQPTSDGTWLLRIRILDVSRVELAADFTDWEPVDLVQTRPGVWELAASLAPGVYRLNLRIDAGDWIVPEGTRQERDDFGGYVGVLVIRR